MRVKKGMRYEAWRGRGECGVVTCSALKRRYRDIIIGNRPDVRPVYLEGSRELIGKRIAVRHGHFMPASLLDSQFAALEPPAPDEHAIAASVDMPVADTVAQIAAALQPRDTKPDHATLTG
jgi:carbohydrate kinase (thermoresistant glucokinase family)